MNATNDQNLTLFSLEYQLSSSLSARLFFLSWYHNPLHKDGTLMPKISVFQKVKSEQHITLLCE